MKWAIRIGLYHLFSDYVVILFLHKILFFLIFFLTDFGCFDSIAGHQASVSEVEDMIHAAYERSIMRPMFCHLSASLCPLPIPLPFPSIFGNLVGQRGELIDGQMTDASRKGSLDVHSIPMAARLRSNCAILPFLETRLWNLHRFGIERGALGAQLLSSWSFGKEELVEMEEMLSKMVTTLSPPQFSSDSD